MNDQQLHAAARIILSSTVPPGSPRFSVVIPVYNEVESLDELIDSVDGAMASMDADYEIVVVDDGSTDGSFARLRALAERRPAIRLFSFRHNVGKSTALTCGFQKARGDFIATLDADLQDDPREIPKMYDHLIRENADVVSGWRQRRRDPPLKVAASKVFNLLVIRRVFGASFRDMNSGCKLYRADVARALTLYGGMHRFIPLILTGMGYKVGEVPVTHHPRKYGQSKYSSIKVLTASPDLLTIFFLAKYTVRPLHFFGRLGAALFAVGFILLVYLTSLWLRSVPIGTRPLLTLGVLLILVGLQIVLTGLLADLILKVNHDNRRDFPLKYEPGQADPRGEP
jgi:glycosyltransferase involved in cell wall biosynthesis